MAIPIDDLFDYNPETGWFTNKINRGRAKAGERAGSVNDKGYRVIKIFGITYREHHLAWFWVYGVWPNELDHQNDTNDDNRISNLRECTRTQNNYNSECSWSQSGLKGVYLDKRSLKWRSQIQCGGKKTFLGVFDTPEEAHEAYIEAYKVVAGEFAHPALTTERTA